MIYCTFLTELIKQGYSRHASSATTMLSTAVLEQNRGFKLQHEAIAQSAHATRDISYVSAELRREEEPGPR